jgi:hypothetical protein
LSNSASSPDAQSLVPLCWACSIGRSPGPGTPFYTLLCAWCLPGQQPHSIFPEVTVFTLKQERWCKLTVLHEELVGILWIALECGFTWGRGGLLLGILTWSEGCHACLLSGLSSMCCHFLHTSFEYVLLSSFLKIFHCLILLLW